MLSDEKGLQVNWRSGLRSLRQNTCLIVFFILDSFYGIGVCTEFQTMCKILLKNQKLVKGGGVVTNSYQGSWRNGTTQGSVRL